jgi:hypothetical protein
MQYLGYFDLVNEVVNNEEVEALIPENEDLVDTDTHRNWFDFNQFMRTENDSSFLGIMSECNTSSIGIKAYREGYKLWRLT